MNPQNAFWSDYIYDLHRFACFGSISLRKSLRNRILNIGDAVSINPQHRGKNVNRWMKGRVVQMDIGQVEVTFVNELDGGGQRVSIWTHLDNQQEIAFLPQTARSGPTAINLCGPGAVHGVGDCTVRPNVVYFQDEEENDYKFNERDPALKSMRNNRNSSGNTADLTPSVRSEGSAGTDRTVHKKTEIAAKHVAKGIVTVISPKFRERDFQRFRGRF